MVKLYTIALAFVLTGAATTANAATTFYLSPASGSYHKGENFEIGVLVDADSAINAVSGVINFPTQRLKVLDISKKNSIINFWVGEPSFSNAGELGNIRFEGVILNPGFTGTRGRVATVVFRAVSEGRSNVDITQSAILANDGKGTNLDASESGASVAVLPAQVLPSPSEAPLAIEAKPQVIFVQPLQIAQPEGTPFFWESLPKWVQVSLLLFVGLATIVFSLIILSFGAIVSFWLWSMLWQRRYVISSLLRRLAVIPKNVASETARSLGVAGAEFEGDVHYSVDRLAEEFRVVPYTNSFGTLVKQHLTSLGNIAKRFLTKSNRESPKREEFGDTEILP